jgi:polyferredoxin
VSLKSLYTQYISSNLSYKLVALFVTLVLWFTLLGRTDLILSHTMELQPLTHPNHVISNQIPGRIRVKVSGPRTGLKKFTQSEPILTLNLEKLKPGSRWVKINKSNINVPVGVKVLSVQPEKIKVNIKQLKAKNE